MFEMSLFILLIGLKLMLESVHKTISGWDDNF